MFGIICAMWVKRPPFLKKQYIAITGRSAKTWSRILWLWRSGSRKKSNIQQFLVLGSATFSHLMIIPEHPSISGGGIIIKHCTQGCHFLKTEFRASQKLLNINTANAVRQWRICGPLNWMFLYIWPFSVLIQLIVAGNNASKWKSKCTERGLEQNC